MSKAAHPRILLIGTGDTKADELLFMSDRIAEAGGEAIMMDVSVLGDPPYSPRYDKHAVAAADGRRSRRSRRAATRIPPCH